MSWIKCPKCGANTELYDEHGSVHTAHQGHKMHEMAKANHPVIAAVGLVITVGSLAVGQLKRRCTRCSWKFL